MKEIPLKKGVAAWVDDEDFEKFGSVKWRLHTSGTACRDGKPFTGRSGLVLLPRLIVGAHAGQAVLPRNNIPLDCRRDNLVVEPKTPQRNQHEENLTAIVLRFIRAFPRQRRFGMDLLRQQLREAWQRSQVEDAEEFLARIDGWAKARANIGPWDLESSAPVLLVPKIDTPAPVINLPPASAHQVARVRSITAEWKSDGTE